MVLSITRIRFEAGIPPFQTICQQYERQTGLPLLLKARIHLFDSEAIIPASSPTSIWALLQTDAATVAALEAAYEAETLPLLEQNQYELAAAARDRMQAQKRFLNHLAGFEFAVGRGEFYAIAFRVNGPVMEVDQYAEQYYAVVFLIKTLVDLGGQCLGADGQPLPNLPAKWRQLKPWDAYKWYNRPPK